MIATAGTKTLPELSRCPTSTTTPGTDPMIGNRGTIPLAGLFGAMALDAAVRSQVLGQVQTSTAPRSAYDRRTYAHTGAREQARRLRQMARQAEKADKSERVKLARVPGDACDIDARLAANYRPALERLDRHIAAAIARAEA